MTLLAFGLMCTTFAATELRNSVIPPAVSAGPIKPHQFATAVPAERVHSNCEQCALSLDPVPDVAILALPSLQNKLFQPRKSGKLRHVHQPTPLTAPNVHATRPRTQNTSQSRDQPLVSSQDGTQGIADGQHSQLLESAPGNALNLHS